MAELYIFLEDISIELCVDETGKDALPKDLKELFVSVHPEVELERSRFALREVDPAGRRWEMTGFIELPPSVDNIKIVLRDEDGEDVCSFRRDCTSIKAGVGGEVKLAYKVSSKGKQMRIGMKRTLVEVNRLSYTLGRLGQQAYSRFERTSGATDIQDAVSLARRALQLTPDGHSGLPARLHLLGTSLRSRPQRTGEVSDLTEAISLQQRAAELTPVGHGNPSLSTILSDLGLSLQYRYDRTGEASDLTEAISVHQRAVKLAPDEHPGLPPMLSNLGLSLLARFERAGKVEDLTEAISVQQRAVQLTPGRDPGLAPRLNNLGSSLLFRFKRTGDVSDLTEAISVFRRAVQLVPDGHPNRITALTNLGVLLWSRFQRTGEMPDLAEAISVQRMAVQLTPDGHPHLQAMLSNLAASLQSRFERTGGVPDITDAIAYQRRAVTLTPDGHPHLITMLNNLGALLRSHFERTKEIPDITEAISVQRRVVQLTPDGHTSFPTWLRNLALSLRSRFELTGEVSNLTEAISVQQRAIQLTPNGHPELCGCLLGMAQLLTLRHTIARRPQNIATAILHCESASSLTTGALRDRLVAAKGWIHLLQVHHPTSPDIIRAFDCLLSIVALGAGLGQTITSRYSHLNGHLDDALHASSTAFAFHRVDKALEWLEQGRCLVWAQLHSLRSPLDDLRAHNGTLANSIADISKTLDTLASTRVQSHQDNSLGEKMALEDEAQVHQDLARKWEALVGEARLIPGFERFLLPPLSRDLLSHLPPSGYVVVINVHANRCDALALSSTAAEPIHIPLPTFSLKAAVSHRDMLNAAFDSHLLRMRQGTTSGDDALVDPVARGFKQLGIVRRPKPPMATVLESLWVNVVKPIFDALGLKTVHSVPGQAPPRIWWCPTGVLSFLPIHAAGIYEDGRPTVSALDYAVSSYTPTVNSLTTRVRNTRKASKAVSGLLMTSQPSPDDGRFAHIPGTTTEVRSLEARAREKGVRALKFEGEEASVEDFIKHMEKFSSVHLACHGSQDATDPLSSRFLFHNGPLELRQIIKENLHNADLAFLSACQTSTGEEKLANEAVHLAAGMLAAGYQRVVATMWSIGDTEAPIVAQDFYDYIFDRREEEGDIGGFDGSRSAEALHHAIQRMRARLDNSERSLLAWSPYVHWGF